MNTRKYLVLVLMLLCVLLSACAPAATATQAPTLTPPTVASTTTSTFSGDPIPDNLLNVNFNLVDGNPPNAMRFYSPDDPICQELNTQGYCFTILVPNKPTDPGARGPAALVNGLIALNFQICPFCGPELGGVEYFQPSEDGGALTGVKCEWKTGKTCNGDVGTTWEPAPELTTFSPKTFNLPITLSYGPDEWRVAEEYSDVFTLSYIGHDAGVSFMNVKNAKYADGIAFPDDFVTWIQSPDSLFQVVDSKPVLVGGFKGIQINATAACGNQANWIILSGTGWKCPNGEHIGFIYLDDVYGERVLIQIQGSPDGKDYIFIVEESQKVLDTVVFTKP